MPPSTPDNLYELGLRGSLYLAALLVAHDERVLVTPTESLTHTVMSLLRDRGVIEVPWPARSWDISPDAKKAHLEQLQWRLSWSVYEADRLGEALGDYFQEAVEDDALLPERVDLWRELAWAEAERFFEDQLLKHRLDGGWAQDLAFTQREIRVVLSAAEWRYCAWAAVRYAAAAVQRDPHLQPAALREALHRELGRRATKLVTGQWRKCTFPPFRPLPDNAAGRLFVTHLAQLGMDFWTLPPGTKMLIQE